MQYLGSGPEAVAVAAEIEQRRQERAALAAAARTASQAFNQTLAPLLDLGHLCDGLMQATLMDQGYHEHKGEWRYKTTHASCNGTQRNGGGEPVQV